MRLTKNLHDVMPQLVVPALPILPVPVYNHPTLGSLFAWGQTTEYLSKFLQTPVLIHDNEKFNAAIDRLQSYYDIGQSDLIGDILREFIEVRDSVFGLPAEPQPVQEEDELPPAEDSASE